MRFQQRINTKNFVMKVLDIFLDAVYELSLVFLDGTTNLKQGCEMEVKIRSPFFLTFGRTKRALNLEKTRNISFAFLAVPRRSRNLAMIWFSTLDTRSLYPFSAATQISVPSEMCQSSGQV
jgi:hypothetical protein